jgi:hypothetical protein
MVTWLRPNAPSLGAQGPLRFGAPQLSPLLQSMLMGLFGALKLPGSSENAYVMRAILRVSSVAAETMAYAAACRTADHRVGGL